jgi:hypothetical protein
VGTVISFLNNNERPYAEIVLDNGDRVVLTLDNGGLTIRQIWSADSKILFQGNPATVAHFCTALVTATRAPDPTPLQTLVAAVVQIASAELVAKAFHDATARIG